MREKAIMWPETQEGSTETGYNRADMRNVFK